MNYRCVCTQCSRLRMDGKVEAAVKSMATPSEALTSESLVRAAKTSEALTRAARMGFLKGWCERNRSYGLAVDPARLAAKAYPMPKVPRVVTGPSGRRYRIIMGPLSNRTKLEVQLPGRDGWFGSLMSVRFDDVAVVAELQKNPWEEPS